MSKWFRYSLLASTILNLGGVVTFALPIFGMGEVFGLPKTHPLYLGIISSWIFIFGVSYLWLALTAKPERFYIAVVAACKLAIAFLFAAFWIMGDLPLLTASAGLGDFLLAIAFIYWLLQTRQKCELEVRSPYLV